jgi:hypothetical protein
MRYFIIHAHKLLDPEGDEDHEHKDGGAGQEPGLARFSPRR